VSLTVYCKKKLPCRSDCGL